MLHTFLGGTDGGYPDGGVIFDAAGNLYGTTSGGAYVESTVFEPSPAAGGADAYQGGIVFELTPGSGSVWTEHVLHNLGEGKDGIEPTLGVVLDAAGNIYGATLRGGAHGYGTVFELSPRLGERILHSFYTFTDGASPYGSLIFDSAGNLYGTASEGGLTGCVREGCGTAFKLSPVAGGAWQETILDLFSVNIDGGFPTSALVFDSAGNLYGTTFGGSGTSAYYGTVFEIPQ